jgi:hypothetical protein
LNGPPPPAQDNHYALLFFSCCLVVLFAPQNDEIIARVFEPADPTAETMTVYRHARELAEQYWGLLSTDTRVSADFRVIAETCGNTLAALPRTGAYAYTDDKARSSGL